MLKVYLICLVFIWIRGTVPRLRADQLMQFAWLILIPITLGNILLTGIVYLLLSGLSLIASLVVIGIINWILLFVFVRLVSHVTNTSTRRAQSPAIYAQRRRTEASQQEQMLLGSSSVGGEIGENAGRPQGSPLHLRG